MQKKLADYDFTLIILILGILDFIITLYSAYGAFVINNNITFSLSLLALFAGLFYESFKIFQNSKNFIFTFIVSYFASLFFCSHAILTFDFELLIMIWPYSFILFYTIGIAIYNKDKVTAKLTEGITLLLSLSLIYWVIDYGFINVDNLFVKLILILGLVSSGFSIINALTNIKLSRTTRLILSIWSTIVMFSFAIDNVLRVLNNGDIENTKYLSLRVSIALQYFLLGVSAVYIIQNFLLLISLLPQKGGNYKKDFKESKKEHIYRYSDKQVNIKLSLFCILYSVTIYILNYKFQILPRHTMIWLVFLTFPIISYFTNRLNELTIAKRCIAK